MNHDCKCGTVAEETAPKIATINAAQLTQLAALSGKSLLATSKAPGLKAAYGTGALDAGSRVQTQFHMTDAGEPLATTSFAEGSSGDIVVRGVIAGLPCELRIKVELDNGQVAVTLHLTKPIEVGPYTWRFDLGGVVKNANGEVVSAASLYPAADAQAMGIGWWCALKCGGLTILPTLVMCLPSFAGGPAAYIACVTAKLGAGDAAAIAACIAKKCIK